MLNKIINRIKLLALFLFITASIAIFGSLYANNYLLQFSYDYSPKISQNLEDLPGSFYEEDCNVDNNYCTDKVFINKWFENNEKLNVCTKYLVGAPEFYANGVLIDPYLFFEGIENMNLKDVITSKSEIFVEKFENVSTKFRLRVYDEINPYCINSSNSKNLYKIFPFFYEFVKKVKDQKLNLASSEKINPFFYGETSISNLVKRYPINYIFKSFLYSSVILMLFYWLNYNIFFSKQLGIKKNIFFFLGIGSAIFLFFHVLFLGWDLDSEIFKKIRRLIIILFILFELLAQVFLAKDLFKNKKLLIEFCRFNVILMKLYYVSFICISSFLIILGLLFFNYSSNIDYILEWNYFVILLIFYFLSSIMWKKNN